MVRPVQRARGRRDNALDLEPVRPVLSPYKTRSASERMYSRNCWGSPAAWAACAFSWMRSGREVVGMAELTQRSEMTQANRAGPKC